MLALIALLIVLGCMWIIAWRQQALVFSINFNHCLDIKVIVSVDWRHTLFISDLIFHTVIRNMKPKYVQASSINFYHIDLDLVLLI